MRTNVVFKIVKEKKKKKKKKKKKQHRQVGMLKVSVTS